MKRQLLCILTLSAVTLTSSVASADWLGFYARGHGSYITGHQRLPYFEINGPRAGGGFAVGAELLQIDVFLDANFQGGGAAWNQLGIGFDMDVIPGPVFLEPGAQVVYFFGRMSDGSDSVNGLFPRAGIQLGGEFLKVLYAGVEGWFGYAFSLPDPTGGPAFIGALYAGVKFKAF